MQHIPHSFFPLLFHLHLVRHVTHRLSFDHLDLLYLLINLLHKSICCQHSVDILQECLDGGVDLSNGSLRIEKYLARIIPQP